MSVDSDNLEKLVCFMLKKSDPDKAERFREVILSNLSDMVEKGFDRERLADLMDNHETDCRRAALRTDVSFRIMEGIMRAHVLTGEAEYVDTLTQLRAALDENPRFFEDLVRESLLESKYWALTRCIPSRTVAEQRSQATKAWLEDKAMRYRPCPGVWKP